MYYCKFKVCFTTTYDCQYHINVLTVMMRIVLILVQLSLWLDVVKSDDDLTFRVIYFIKELHCGRCVMKIDIRTLETHNGENSVINFPITVLFMLKLAFRSIIMF